MPEQAPFNSDQVLGLVEKTLLGLWTDLISHLPLLIGGLIILVLFFGLSKAAIFAGKRVMHGWNKGMEAIKTALDEAGIETPSPTAH
jgi:hypothetical protein